MPEAMRLGQEAVMLYGAAGSAATNPMGIVESNSPSLKNNEVKGNFRGSRKTNTRAGQQDLTGSVTMWRKTSDAAYQAFKAAAVAGTTIALKLIPINGNTDEAIDCDVAVLSWDTPEDMDGIQKATFNYARNTDQRDGTIT